MGDLSSTSFYVRLSRRIRPSFRRFFRSTTIYRVTVAHFYHQVNYRLYEFIIRGKAINITVSNLSRSIFILIPFWEKYIPDIMRFSVKQTCYCCINTVQSVNYRYLTFTRVIRIGELTRKQIRIFLNIMHIDQKLVAKRVFMFWMLNQTLFFKFIVYVSTIKCETCSNFLKYYII